MLSAGVTAYNAAALAVHGLNLVFYAAVQVFATFRAVHCIPNRNLADLAISVPQGPDAVLARDLVSGATRRAVERYERRRPAPTTEDAARKTHESLTSNLATAFLNLDSCLRGFLRLNKAV